MHHRLRLAIKKRLLVTRKLRGLSQDEVGRRVGVAGATVSRWEDPRKDEVPAADKLRRLSDVYECSADYLLGISDLPCGMVAGSNWVDQDLLDAIESVRQGVARVSVLDKFAGPDGRLPWHVTIPRNPRQVGNQELHRLQKQIPKALKDIGQETGKEPP